MNASSLQRAVHLDHLPAHLDTQKGEQAKQWHPHATHPASGPVDRLHVHSGPYLLCRPITGGASRRRILRCAHHLRRGSFWPRLTGLVLPRFQMGAHLVQLDEATEAAVMPSKSRGYLSHLPGRSWRCLSYHLCVGCRVADGVPTEDGLCSTQPAAWPPCKRTAAARTQLAGRLWPCQKHACDAAAVALLIVCAAPRPRPGGQATPCQAVLGERALKGSNQNQNQGSTRCSSQCCKVAAENQDPERQDLQGVPAAASPEQGLLHIYPTHAQV